MSGSAARGKTTATSDLDIVVIQNGNKHYRDAYIFEDWPVEVFVQSEDSLFFFFQIEQEEGLPLLIRLCAEGVPIRGEKTVKKVRKDAMNLLADGPNPWSEKKIKESRYILTYLLEDLEGSGKHNENIFTAHTLIEQALVFYLRSHKQWIGEGKWLYRCLLDVDQDFAEQFASIITHFHKTGHKQELIKLIDQMMDPYGGRFFEGFTG